MTPYLIDRYQNYSDAVNANINNPLAGFKNASYNQQHVYHEDLTLIDSLTITRTPGAGGG